MTEYPWNSSIAGNGLKLLNYLWRVRYDGLRVQFRDSCVIYQLQIAHTRQCYSKNTSINAVFCIDGLLQCQKTIMELIIKKTTAHQEPQNGLELNLIPCECGTSRITEILNDRGMTQARTCKTNPYPKPIKCKLQKCHSSLEKTFAYL